MKNKRWLNIILTLFMVLNTVVTPQMAYAVSGVLNSDEADETHDVNVLSEEGETEDEAEDEDGNGNDEVGSEGQVPESEGDAEGEADGDSAEQGEGIEEDPDSLVESDVDTSETDTGSKQADGNEDRGPPVEVFEKGRATPKAFVPQAVNIEGNYVSEFKFVLISNGEEIPFNEDGSINIEDPSSISHANIDYKFSFPDDLDINQGDTYEVKFPEAINVSPRTGTIKPDNGPEVNYVITADGRIIFEFTDNWNIDTKVMHLQLQTALDIEMFEESREVVVDVPYVDGEGFHAVLVGPRDGVQGADWKTGNTFDASGTKTTFRPNYAEWTIRVNDQLKIYEEASVVDELIGGHSLDETSIEIYRIPRNYLTGEKIGDPVLVDSTNYTINSGTTGFTIDFGSIEDTYEIRYRTNIDYETVESQTTINNTARITLDGTENSVNNPIDLEWGNDFDPIVKTGSVDNDDITRINWEVRYNFSKHNLGDVILTDTLGTGKIDVASIEVFEVGVDSNGNPTSWNRIEDYSNTPNDKGTEISIPNSNGKSYVIRFASDIPGNYKGEVKNTIDDENLNTPPGEAVVEVNTVPTGSKAGQVKYEEGQAYIEWTVKFNENRVIFDEFTFIDSFNKDHLVVDDSSFVLKKEIGNQLVRNEDYTVTTTENGFDFELEGSSEKEVYTLTYRTNYTADGLKQLNVTNEIDWVWDGEGVGPEPSVGHPVAGINKTGTYVVGEDSTGKARQEIAWSINFNTNQLVLTTPKLVDTFSPAELEIVSGTFEIKTGDNTLVEGEDYTFTSTNDGFEVQFINNSLPQVYTVNYRTTIPELNDAPSINTAQLEWQGNTEEDSTTVNKEINKPGSHKNGITVTYKEGETTLKKNEWDIRFNTNKRIIQDLVLTDTYSRGTIVDDVVITRVGGEDLIKNTDYTIEYADGQFVVDFLEQTEPVEYSLRYSTSYNAVEDRTDANNKYTISFLGGVDEDSETISRPTLNVQKASTGVTPTVVNEDGSITPAVISWQVDGNVDGPNYVHLINAVFEDTIQNDQRYVEGTMKLNGVAIAEEDISWTGSYEDTTRTFTVELPDGAAEHTLTYETEIYNYQSNDVSDPSRYHNSVKLVNFKDNVGGTEETVNASSSVRYFSNHDKQNPTKSGEQDPDDDLIKWVATVNENQLPIKDGVIRDIIDEHQYYFGLPEVYAVIDGKDLLIPETGYTYKEMEVEGKPAFTITFNGPTDFTPNEVDNGIHYTYKLKYNTSLNEDIVGVREVGNKIQIIGHDAMLVEEIVSVPTYSEKWYVGGGGSSRTLTMKFSKVDADNNENLLEGVEFQLYRVLGADNNLNETIKFTTLKNGYKELTTQRAGRYVLREISTLPDYVKGSDIHFIIGYDKDGKTIIDITDDEFNDPQRLEDDLLIITNEKQKTTVSANKVWEGENPHQTVWFKLYRQIGEDGTLEEVPEAVTKELAVGTTQVTWDNIVKLDPEGKEYIFTVKEVDADENDYVQVGFTKSEDGLTVTNTSTPIEVTVTKTWEDISNQDGIRPKSIDVQLIGENRTPVGVPQELNEENNWSYTFDNLPAYSNGNLINYSVEELTVPSGYNSVIGELNNGTIEVTNTHVPYTTEVKVTKDWYDSSNQDNTRPESVQVQLLADSAEVEGTVVTLSETNDWTYSWTDLPLNEGGEKIKYSVKELNVPHGYTANVNDDNHTDIRLSNSYTPLTTTVSGTKEWDDDNNRDGIRPGSITVYLHASYQDEPVDSKVVKPNAAGEWIYEFTDLPVNAPNQVGVPVAYTVSEEEVKGYETKVNGLEITNTHTPELINISGQKEWVDADDQDGKRPDEIIVRLFSNGNELDSVVVTSATNWAFEFNNVLKFENGEEINYTIQEDAVDGYWSNINGFEITNSYTPEKTSVNVVKGWEDNNNVDARPEFITVNLLADGKEVAAAELTAENNWQVNFTELDKYAAGKLISYTVNEEVPVGFVQVGIDGNASDGYVIKNRPAKVSVGDYVWFDENRDGLQDETDIPLAGVVLVLKDVDGNRVEKDVYGNPIEPQVTDENGYYTFDNLPINNVYVVEIDQVASAEALRGYTPTIETEDNREFDSSTWSVKSVNLDEDGQRDPTLDFGFVKKRVSVGDYVWIDENKDGLQDETDTPLAGVTLILKDDEGNIVTEDVDGNPIEPQVTDENGYYSFDELPGDKRYTVEIDREASKEALKGLMPTIETEDDREKDSSTWSEESEFLNEDGQRDPTLDFGFVRKRVSVGDYVWIDENKDGLQDETDTPLAGVTLILKDEEGNVVTEDVDGNPIEPQVTDENGYYSFDDLPGDIQYTVEVDREAFERDFPKLTPTIDETGDNSELDSSTWSVDSVFLDEDGQRDPTLDFGFIRKQVSVGDYVWIDLNRDGLQDDTDIPLPGVVLEIVDSNGDSVINIFGEPVETTTTDENGWYTFENLPADETYTVRIKREESEEALKGFDITLEEIGEDNAVDSSTWEATSRHLTEDKEHDPTLDFGFIRKRVSVGDYVWFDENKDGKQNDDEPGIPGVVLIVRDKDGNPVTDVFGNPVEPTTTDENGYYSFENLPAENTYTVYIDREKSAQALDGFVPTLEGVGDREKDSSNWVAVSRYLENDDEHDPTLDFGFVRIPEPEESEDESGRLPGTEGEESGKAKEKDDKDDDSDLPPTGDAVTYTTLGLTLLILGGLFFLYDRRFSSKSNK